jgi:hypothetical protein
MKTFKLTAAQVSEKYFGEDVDLEIMKDEQKKSEKSISKMNKIISSEIDKDLTLTITYEPLPPVVMP